MKISTVLAVYDEKENITALLQRLVNIFRTIQCEYEFILVIQGKDGTRDAVARWSKEQGVAVITRYYAQPIGVGSAFKLGFSLIGEDATQVLTMDADLNHQPEELPRFVHALNTSGVDIVIGSRYIPGGKMQNVRPWRYLLSRLVNDSFHLFTNLKNIRDKTSGYRLQNKEVVCAVREKLKAKDFDFYIEYLLRAQKAGFTMCEIPITFIARIKGKSKMRIIETCLRYCLLIFRTLFE